MKTIAKVLCVVLSMVLLICAFAVAISAEDTAATDSGTVKHLNTETEYSAEAGKDLSTVLSDINKLGELEKCHITISLLAKWIKSNHESLNSSKVML